MDFIDPELICERRRFTVTAYSRIKWPFFAVIRGQWIWCLLELPTWFGEHVSLNRTVAVYVLYLHYLHPLMSPPPSLYP